MAGMKKPRLGWRDGLVKLFRATTDEEREEIVKQIEGEAGSDPKPARDEPDAPPAPGGGHTTTINIHGSPVAPPAEPAGEKPAEGPRDDKPEPPAGENETMDEDKIKELCGGMIGEAVDAKLGPVMEAITALGVKLDDATAKAAEASDKVDAVVEAVEDMTDPEDMATQDAVARAEVLKPGTVAPVTDAKPGSKGHRDALVTFQRKVLSEAFASDEMARAAIRDAYGAPSPNFKTLLPAEVGILFRAASSAVAATRDAAATPAHLTFAPRHFDGAERKVESPADINKRNRERWAR